LGIIFISCNLTLTSSSHLSSSHFSSTSSYFTRYNAEISINEDQVTSPILFNPMPVITWKHISSINLNVGFNSNMTIFMHISNNNQVLINISDYSLNIYCDSLNKSSSKSWYSQAITHSDQGYLYYPIGTRRITVTAKVIDHYRVDITTNTNTLWGPTIIINSTLLKVTNSQLISNFIVNNCSVVITNIIYTSILSNEVIRTAWVITNSSNNYWIETNLTGVSGLDGGKVYIAGKDDLYQPCYWAGTIKYKIADSGIIRSIYVTNNIVYTCGEDSNGNACYWIGTNETQLSVSNNESLLSFGGIAEGICIYNGFVYTAGGDHYSIGTNMIFIPNCYYLDSIFVTP